MDKQTKMSYKNHIEQFITDNKNILIDIFNDDIIAELEGLLDKFNDIIMAWTRQFLVDNVDNIWPVQSVSYEQFKQCNFVAESKYVSLYVNDCTIKIIVNNIESKGFITEKYYNDIINDIMIHEIESLLANLYNIIKKTFN